MHRYRTPLLATLCALLFLAAPAAAQVTSPAASPYATAAERVGLTDITIKYNRPAVNGRQVWGGLVPYGLATPFPGFGSGNPFPWRAGANENTTIAFGHDVLIEGQPLAAGTYGLHMIPTESDWTIIFSENATSWGSFFYDQSEDALRVTVTPEAAPHKERLTYEFMNHTAPAGVTVALLWEELMVPIRVEVANPHEVVMASMRNELRSTAGFGWQGWSQAAGYALTNNINLEEALGWAEQAVQRNENFNTLRVKAGLLAQLNRGDEADAVMETAIASANENQLNAYGYQLVGQQRMDDALRIFTMNVERHPQSWNPHDSLAEAYATMGDTANARTHYQHALDLVPATDEANRTRIQRTLADLGTGSQ